MVGLAGHGLQPEAGTSHSRQVTARRAANGPIECYLLHVMPSVSRWPHCVGGNLPWIAVVLQAQKQEYEKQDLAGVPYNVYERGPPLPPCNKVRVWHRDTNSVALSASTLY